MQEPNRTLLSIFDRDAFFVRIGNSMEFYQKLTAIFLQRVPELLSDLQAGIEANDLEKIIFSSHSLKGFSLNIGADMLSEISKEVEDKARHYRDIEAKVDINRPDTNIEQLSGIDRQNIEEIRSLSDSLEGAFSDFCHELEKYQDR